MPVCYIHKELFYYLPDHDWFLLLFWYVLMAYVIYLDMIFLYSTCSIDLILIYLRIDIFWSYLTLLLNFCAFVLEIISILLVFAIKVIMIYEINERFDMEKLEIILQKHNNNRYEKGSLELLETN